MSRLVGYGTGEVVDRLTILELKILHGRAAGTNVLHFEEEWTALIVPLKHQSLYFHKAIRLAVVNAALWAAEDEMRAYQSLYPGKVYSWEEIGKLGLRIQQLNDQRAVLVATINALVGEGAPPEKA